MPLYEYRCEKCGHRFELWQRLGAGKEGVQCPKCGADQVTRLLSTFASTSSSAPCGASASSCSSGFS
jgi:putative FmdB family regulatory protein